MRFWQRRVELDRAKCYRPGPGPDLLGGFTHESEEPLECGQGSEGAGVAGVELNRPLELRDGLRCRAPVEQVARPEVRLVRGWVRRP